MTFAQCFFLFNRPPDDRPISSLWSSTSLVIGWLERWCHLNYMSIKWMKCFIHEGGWLGKVTFRLSASPCSKLGQTRVKGFICNMKSLPPPSPRTQRNFPLFPENPILRSALMYIERALLQNVSLECQPCFSSTLSTLKPCGYPNPTIPFPDPPWGTGEFPHKNDVRKVFQVTEVHS